MSIMPSHQAIYPLVTQATVTSWQQLTSNPCAVDADLRTRAQRKFSMISHVHVGVTDFDRAFGFYSNLMDALGFPLMFCERERPWAGWMPAAAARPLFLIGRPENSEGATPGNGQMVALLAPSRAAVDVCYARALAGGGCDDGPPGPRPHYHPNYYGAYFHDPDGNKICVCCHDIE